MMGKLQAATVALCLCLCAQAAAQDECREHAYLPTTRLVWKTAHALLGRPPTLDELLQVRGLDPDHPNVDALIDIWLDSDDHRVQMRRYHMQEAQATPLPEVLRIHTNTLRYLVPVRCSDAEGCSYDPPVSSPDPAVDGSRVIWDWIQNSSQRRGNRYHLTVNRRPMPGECSLALGPVSAGVPDPTGRYVRTYLHGDGDPVRVFAVPEAPGCRGWFYDDPENPRLLTLCDDLCSDAYTRWEVQFVPQPPDRRWAFRTCTDTPQAENEAYCDGGDVCVTDEDCGEDRCDAGVTDRCVPADCCRPRHSGVAGPLWGRRVGPDPQDCREGAEAVQPYWAQPGDTRRVCASAAWAAQTFEQPADPPNFLPGTFSCADLVPGGLPGHGQCGCGPGLAWCQPQDTALPLQQIGRTTDGVSYEVDAERSVFDVVRRAMMEQFLRMVDEHAFGRDDDRDGQLEAPPRPYHELLTTRDTWVNGPLIHFYRHLARVGGRDVAWIERPEQAYWGADADNGFVAPLDLAACAGGRCEDGELPTRREGDPAWRYTFVDANWYRVERGALHSGVLTTPAFLHRFRTNRARVNRFRLAFLDQSFSPPAEIETPESTVLDPAPCYYGDAVGDDLRRRCLCRSCHRQLEPMAAHFGPFLEYGTALTSVYPLEVASPSEAASFFHPTVATGAWSEVWSRIYEITELPDPNDDEQTISAYRQRAVLLSRSYPGDEQNYAQGPRGLVAEALEVPNGAPSSALAEATVRKIFRFLVGRDLLVEGARDEERPLLDVLSGELEGHWNLKRLIGRIVRLPQFRRAS